MLFILLWHFQGSREKEGSRCSKRKATIEARGCKEKAQRSQTAHERRPGKQGLNIERSYSWVMQEREVWEKEDKMEVKDFDLEHYFRLHDVDKSGRWNRQEVIACSWFWSPANIPRWQRAWCQTLRQMCPQMIQTLQWHREGSTQWKSGCG